MKIDIQKCSNSSNRVDLSMRFLAVDDGESAVILPSVYWKGFKNVK